MSDQMLKQTLLKSMRECANIEEGDEEQIKRRRRNIDILC